MQYLIILVALLSFCIRDVVCEYPFGCTECLAKNFTYCLDQGVYHCYRNLDKCSSITASVVKSCTGVPKQCYDWNYDCAGCIAAPVTDGCQMCASTGAYCMGAFAACGTGTSITKTSGSCSGAPYTKALNCIGLKSCDSCVAASCFWIPDSATIPVPGGCSSTNYYSASAPCGDARTICPARTSGKSSDMCNCATDTLCSICYDVDTPESNYMCTSRSQPFCTKSYDKCTAPEINCPPLLSKFDPWGTRCNCLTNPACSICVTNPSGDATPTSLKCVSTANQLASCSTLTRNCQDPTVICPTRLTCDTCKATTGCTWCRSGDVGLSSKCTAGSTCSAPFVADTTCTDTCGSYTTCATCKAASCNWCNSTTYIKAACMGYCDTVASPQSIVSTCPGDKCTDYSTCNSCTTNKCTWCEGIGRSDGSSAGRYCTSSSNCNNPVGCGFFNPCFSDVYNNATTCPTAVNHCSGYTSCVACQGQTVNPVKCYWCDKGGTRFCDTTCTAYNTVKVANCAYFGATTGGLPIGTTGATGSASTGSAGDSSTGYVPPPGAIPTPTSPSTPTNPPSTGSTPSGTNPPSTGSTPSGTNPPSTGSTPSGTNPPSTGSTPSGTNPPSTGSTPSAPSTGSTPSGTNPPSTGSTPSGTNPPSTGSTPTDTNPPSTGSTPSGTNPPSTGSTPSGTNPPSTGATPSAPSDTPSPTTGQTTGATTGGANNGGSNQGILGGGRGVVNGFDWALFGIILGILILLIIIIVLVVVVVKAKATETV